MLSNPHLLDYIHNKHLPYLSSASCLQSRLKRRQRMRRNEPVWVKPFDEIFPWAEGEDLGHPVERWERFWKGWLAVLICAKYYFDQINHGVGPVLRIGHVLNSEKFVEVDIVELMKKKAQEKEINGMTAYYVQFQDGMVLLGVKLGVREGSPGIDIKYQICYLFLFDLSGTVLSHISFPDPEGLTIQTTRFNSTHLLVLHATRVFDDRSHRLLLVLKVNIYSFLTGEREIPEITIRPIPGNFILTQVRKLEDNIIANIKCRLGFDAAGMVWFPQFEAYTLEFSCLEQSGAGKLVWESGNLPLSPCGAWVIFSGLHGLPRQLATVHLNSGVVNNNPNVSFPEPSELPPTAYTTALKDLVVTNSSKTTLLISHDPPVIADHILRTPRNLVSANLEHNYPNSHSFYNLIFQNWKSKMRYPSTHKITISAGALSMVVTPLRNHLYDAVFVLSTPITNIPAFWGYIGEEKYGVPSWLARNLILLPYSDGGHMESGYKNGIPEQVWREMEFPIMSGDVNAPLDMPGVRWHWGDDGLIAWEVGTMGSNATRAQPQNLWVVCYEEEWDLQGTSCENESEIENDDNDDTLES